jgi:CubicO group peptidase (beta-lactamase class C family)
MNKVIFILALFFTFNAFGQKLHKQQISMTLDSLRKANEIEGLQVVIVSSDSVLYQESFGRKKGGHQGIDNTSIFCVSSITKSFTSIGIMKLVERGEISLDDKLKDIAPEISFENPWEETHPLKVVHLLEHTTGWSDVVFSQFAADRQSLSIFEQANDFPGSRVCNYPPGQYFSYQNTGPTVAGYLLEKISGSSYEEFIKNEILDPLNMYDSSLDPASGLGKDRLAIAIADNVPYRLIVDVPSGGMFTNSHDMSKYLRLLLNQGTVDGITILSPASMNRMTTAQSTLSGKSRYEIGYGLGLWSDRFKGIKLIGHSGEQPSFGSYMIVIPELDRAFFVASNTELPPLNPVITALQNFIVDSENTWLPEEGKPSKKETIAGYYRSLNTPSNTGKIGAFLNPILTTSWIGEEDGELFYTALTHSKRYRLYEDGANHIYYTDGEGYKNWFFVGENWQGNSILQNGKSSGNLKRVSAISVWGSLALSVFCTLMILSLPLVLLIRLILKYLIRSEVTFQPAIQLMSTAFFSLLTAALVIAFIVPPADSSPPEIWKFLDTVGKITPTSIAIFTLTLLFGLFSVLAMLVSVNNIRRCRSGLLKIYILGLNLVFAAICGYLLTFDLVPFRSWLF